MKKYDAVKWRAVKSIFLSAVIIFPLLCFAGWQSWLYGAVLFFPLIFACAYLLKRDPELLARRMQYREKKEKQQAIISVAAAVFIAEIVLIAADRYFAWSRAPVWAVLAADAATLAGYLLVFWVFKENSWASRIIEVVPGQKLITTGPYAIIRHPMYLGALVMVLAMPVALGTLYPAAAFVPYAALIILRIADEEAMLKRDLAGYVDYCGMVKYRLIPGIW